MCDKEDKCEIFTYLKPLTIDSLFEVDDCTKYADTLEKAKRVRNAFFAAKTSVYNFISDCDVIADTIQSDLSDNEVEMDNIENQYYAVLNNLQSALYTSLKQTYNGKQLINVDLAKVDETTNPSAAARPQKSTDLSFVHPWGKGKNTLAHCPGVTLQHYLASKMLKIKFSEPKWHSGYNRHGQYKKEQDVVTTLVLAPSVFCTGSWYNWDESDPNTSGLLAGGEFNSYNQNGGSCSGQGPGRTDFSQAANNRKDLGGDAVESVFANCDIAMDFFEEFQNYQDNHILNAESSYGNQVLEVMNYFDRVITTMEGAHRFVVQLSRINGTAPTDAADCCPRNSCDTRNPID